MRMHTFWRFVCYFQEANVCVQTGLRIFPYLNEEYFILYIEFSKRSSALKKVRFKKSEKIENFAKISKKMFIIWSKAHFVANLEEFGRKNPLIPPKESSVRKYILLEGGCAVACSDFQASQEIVLKSDFLSLLIIKTNNLIGTILK
jgi:hypothetical protein